MLVAVQVRSILEIERSLRHDVGRIFVRARILRNPQRIVGLVQLQRRALIARNRMRHRVCARALRIHPAWQQAVLSVHLFEDALGLIRPNHVFDHDHVAGLGDREIWLRSHDHSERLERCRYFDIVLRARGKNFAQILRPAVRRDGPQHIGKVLVAEAVGWSESLEMRVDRNLAALTGHLRFALCTWKQRSSVKSDRRRPASVQIVHAVQIALDYMNSIDIDAVLHSNRVHVRSRRIDRGGIRLLRHGCGREQADAAGEQAARE